MVGGASDASQLCVQPVVELATRTIHSYEVPMLLRREAVAAAAGATLILRVREHELAELARGDDPIWSHTGRLVLEVRDGWDHLAGLRARGAHVALELRGICANFASLARLAPELVTLDRGLIAGLTAHSGRHRLLSRLAALCTASGARVVANGVETHGELMAVIAAGIPLARGQYLRSRSASGTPTWTPC